MDKDYTDKELNAMIPDRPILKVYKPYSLAAMNKEVSRHTICNELRKAYRNIEQNDLESAGLSIRIAMSMAKAMSTKLKSYNLAKSKELWPAKSALKHGGDDNGSR